MAAPGPVARRTPSLRRRLFFLGLGVVLAIGLGIGLFSTRGTGSAGPPRAGDQVPAFSLPRLGGGPTVSVPADGGGGGRPAVLLFFASWCGPCQKEVPAIARTWNQEVSAHSPLASVRLVGVDGNDPTAAALGFVHRSGVTFPVGADRDYAVTEGKFQFTGLPEVVFVSPDGTIAGVHLGALSSAAFTRWQRRLLSPSGT